MTDTTVTDVPDQQHEDATEIGLVYLQRYIPPGTVLPDPLPQEVLDAANEIGHRHLARYEPVEDTGVEPPPLEELVARALAALPPPTAPPTFMELQKKMQDEMAAQADPLTPEQEEARRLNEVRYTPPPEPQSYAEQVAAMNVEAVELTPEQQEQADLVAQRYVAPPPPPPFIELQEKMQAELEAQRVADLQKLFAPNPTPPEPLPTEVAP